MTHQEVCDSARRIVNSIVREDRFSDVRVDEEDRHDGKKTFVFSFTPSVATESEVQHG